MKRRLLVIPRIKLRGIRGDSPEALVRRAAALAALGRYEKAVHVLKETLAAVEADLKRTDKDRKRWAARLAEEFFHVVERAEEDAKLIHRAGLYDEAELAFSEALALLGYVPDQEGLSDRIDRRRKRLLANLAYAIFMQARKAEGRGGAKSLREAFRLYEKARQLVKEGSIHWLEMERAHDEFMRQHSEELEEVKGAPPSVSERVGALLEGIDYEPEGFYLTPEQADFELELVRFYAASGEFDKALKALEKIKLSGKKSEPREGTAETASSARPYESTVLFVADKMLSQAMSLSAHRLKDKISLMEKALELFNAISSPVEGVELELAELYIEAGEDEGKARALEILSRLRSIWERELEEGGEPGAAGLGGVTELCRKLARAARLLKALGVDADETRYWEAYARLKREILQEFIKAREEDDTIEVYREMARRKRGEGWEEPDTEPTTSFEDVEL